MSRRALAGASLLVVATMVLAALLAGLRLPPEARLPIHWDLHGRVDGYAGKWPALLTGPAMAALLSILFYVLPALEPRRGGLERSQGLYLWAWVGLLLTLSTAELTVIGAALGWHLPVDRLILAACGAMFAMIGNQLGKSRSMYMVGIRTPWTLASEEVWVATHRLGGKMMTAAGLAILLLVLLPVPAPARFALSLALVLASTLVPTAYSYWLWRRRERD